MPAAVHHHPGVADRQIEVEISVYRSGGISSQVRHLRVTFKRPLYDELRAIATEWDLVGDPYEVEWTIHPARRTVRELRLSGSQLKEKERKNDGGGPSTFTYEWMFAGLTTENSGLTLAHLSAPRRVVAEFSPSRQLVTIPNPTRIPPKPMKVVRRKRKSDLFPNRGIGSPLVQPEPAPSIPEPQPRSLSQPKLAGVFVSGPEGQPVPLAFDATEITDGTRMGWILWERR